MKKRKTGKDRAMYAFGGIEIGDDGKPKKSPATTEQVNNFSVLGGTSDIKGQAVYLGKRGLIGTSNLLMDNHPLTTGEGSFDTKSGVVNKKGLLAAQSVWIPSAMSTMLGAARKMNLRTPTELKANREALLGSLTPEYKEALNHPAFAQNYPNYWDTFNNVISDQYSKETNPTVVASNFALGTSADGVKPKTDGLNNLGGYSGLLSSIPGIANGIIDLFEKNPNAYSDQPIMNASTIKGMKTPYSFAMGGEVGDEEELQQLQEMADEQGISIEELVAQLQSAQDPDDMEDGQEEYIPEEEEEEVDEDGIGETFGGEFALGGRVRSKVPIEVEGGEVLENPLGTVKKAVGPSHAKGGVDVNVLPGTKVYSDRVKIDGKTMAERKIRREKAEKRIEKLKLKHEYDPLVNNSLQRTMQVNQAEEAEDMQLQEALKGIEDRKKFAYGGDVEDPFDPLAGTGLTDPTLPRLGQTPYNSGYLAGINPIVSSSFRTSPTTIQTPTFNNGVGSPAPQPLPDVETPDGSPFSTGDYVGMAGNLFNAVAPFINTRNAAAATKPTVNRYRGFGREAIQGNDQAQVLANTMGSEALTDIDTSANSAIERGRNSASSVNTARVMDIATTLGANKAKVAARDATTKQLIGLTGQRGQLTNMKDRMEMSGQERADIENEAKTDNYFSNNAANLVNFGNNIQGLGRNLNTSKQNQVDANLIASMAKNDIKVDTGSGKIVNKNMSPEQVQRYLDMGYTIDERTGKLTRPRKRG